MAVDSVMTGRLKAYAREVLAADLVGVANIERFAHAPLMMSPQGLFPAARSVVVMAIHHPDACIELGGLTHPQEIGPYRVQYRMNDRLDEMSYRLGVWLEREGYRAVPIVSSNIWRYKGYKELTAHFAPDMSHIYASVAAGLSDLGYSGLAITPEYGARQRFVTVITDAILEPTPLLEPGSVCDDCGLCVRLCPSGALSKELGGLDELPIEDKVYTKANKNLWRCAWGEHFDLDLDLPIPEVVDEAVILANVREHGLRGGEMGCCLRFCVPKARRYFDRGYADAPRRRRNTPAGDEGHRGLGQAVAAMAYRQGCDFVAVPELGDVTRWLPDGRSAVTLGLRYRRPEGPDLSAAARSYLLDAAAYDVTREIERWGYSAVCATDLDEATVQAQFTGLPAGWAVQTHTVICAAELSPTSLDLAVPAPPPLDAAQRRAQLARLTAELGADVMGVAPAERLDALHPALSEVFDGMARLDARDVSHRFMPYEPRVTASTVQVKRPEDHLAGAKSVLVIGLRLPRASVERTALPPAESVGPYAFAQYESTNLLRLTALRVMRWLEDRGHRATLSFDLCGTGSVVGNPRGDQPDAFANRFAAVAAGLGHLSRAGFVVSPVLGPFGRYVAVITDAEIAADEVIADAGLTAACEDCTRCVSACATTAFGPEATVEVAGNIERFRPIERTRCDWSKRYSLNGEEGVNFLGWDLNLPAPDVISAESLATALRQQPAIPKYRPCNFEACLLACPMVR
ncbi:MAG: hypothetical protein HZB16_13880 [Armatimonadetes bacterium]|nr:hypothetical protein [Armatimonadota bacterium]